MLGATIRHARGSSNCTPAACSACAPCATRSWTTAVGSRKSSPPGSRGSSRSIGYAWTAAATFSVVSFKCPGSPWIGTGCGASPSARRHTSSRQSASASASPVSGSSSGSSRRSTSSGSPRVRLVRHSSSAADTRCDPDSSGTSSVRAATNGCVCFAAAGCARATGPASCARATGSVSSPTMFSSTADGRAPTRSAGGIAAASSASQARCRCPPTSRQRTHHAPSSRRSSGTTRPARTHRSMPCATCARKRRSAATRWAGNRCSSTSAAADGVNACARTSVSSGPVTPAISTCARCRNRALATIAPSGSGSSDGASGAPGSGWRHSTSPAPGVHNPCSIHPSNQPPPTRLAASRRAVRGKRCFRRQLSGYE